MTRHSPLPHLSRVALIASPFGLASLLAACTSTPAPIVTPGATPVDASPSAQTAWQGAPTPTPTPTPSTSASISVMPTTTSEIQSNPSQAPRATKPASTAVNPAAPQPADQPGGRRLDGVRVAVDPGHNGGNFNATKTIARKVPDGRGGEKACNTTGTATANGYKESTFNWEVSRKLKATLEERGATVTLTRDSDAGVGPCVDQRGAAGNDADVLVSIHANGSDNKSIRGWFLLYSSAPLNHQQGDPSRLLAGHLAETLKTQGFPTNPAGPYTPRSDIATINHSAAPVVMLELLEMKNAEDAALAQDPAAQQRYATAIADGITNWITDPRRTQ